MPDIREVDALIRYVFHEDPSELNDDEWVKRYHETVFVLNFQAQKMNPLGIK